MNLNMEDPYNPRMIASRLKKFQMCRQGGKTILCPKLGIYARLRGEITALKRPALQQFWTLDKNVHPC